MVSLWWERWMNRVISRLEGTLEIASRMIVGSFVEYDVETAFFLKPLSNSTYVWRVLDSFCALFY